jgi:hypothetical protein
VLTLAVLSNPGWGQPQPAAQPVQSVQPVQPQQGVQPVQPGARGRAPRQYATSGGGTDATAATRAGRTAAASRPQGAASGLYCANPNPKRTRTTPSEPRPKPGNNAPFLARRSRLRPRAPGLQQLGPVSETGV